MVELLNNLAEFVKMIFAVVVQPNYGASSISFSLFTYLFDPFIESTNPVSAVLLLTFGIGLAGVSVGILKRFLWKS